MEKSLKLSHCPLCQSVCPLSCVFLSQNTNSFLFFLLDLNYFVIENLYNNVIIIVMIIHTLNSRNVTEIIIIKLVIIITETLKYFVASSTKHSSIPKTSPSIQQTQTSLSLSHLLLHSHSSSLSFPLGFGSLYASLF